MIKLMFLALPFSKKTSDRLGKDDIYRLGSNKTKNDSIQKRMD